uniref:Protein TIC 214 n=1 Tax=Silene conica TaxID=39875 RepID=H2BLJ4_SILCO|nr:hypothetical chloroplast RF19 [Silene conica]YP_005089552.1 hypothetical chloroplast RF19 [Silene conica]AEC04048.1 hypothetical chloroplast RF19 [Silene conica]AEC04060.1 hypothetical chloroplast RF19 [Silene conica]
MNFKSLLVSLCMKISNSVVVVGLYYGFLTTLSIGPSYLFLLRAQMMDLQTGEEAAEKKVAAITGFIMGQLVTFISIYYTPLYLALDRPHTMSCLALTYLLFFFFWNNSQDFLDYYNYESPRGKSMRNLRVFLNNLIFQLLNHFVLPSSTLNRLVNIYMFRCNNKILFVTSSLVAWLIGQILWIKGVEWGIVWIQQNYHSISLKQLALIRSNKSIRINNKYLLFEFIDYMHQIFILIVFVTCGYSLGRMSSAFFTLFNQLTEEIEDKEDKADKPEVETKETKQEEEGFNPTAYLFEDPDPENSPTDNQEENLEEENLEEENLEEENLEEERSLHSRLFDYHSWHRPMRYIKNDKLENAVRDEMSQYFFYTCQSDGKKRIAFTFPPSLSLFWEMLQSNLSLSTTENLLDDELYNSWISINEQKKNNLSNEFANRIAVLDKGRFYIDGLDKKTQLCKGKTKKEYLPKINDPFLNGPYRGIIKKKKNVVQKYIDGSLINKIYSILRIDPIIINNKKKDIPSEIKEIPSEIKEISKTVPYWPYKLLEDYDVDDGQEVEDVDLIQAEAQIESREFKRLVLFDAKAQGDPYDPIEYTSVIDYPSETDFARDVIIGSARSQRRKVVIFEILIGSAHSILFLDRIDNLILVILSPYIKLFSPLIKPILKNAKKKEPFKISNYYNQEKNGQAALTEEKKIEIKKQKELEEQEEKVKQGIEDHKNDTLIIWDSIPHGVMIRNCSLLSAVIFRKYILFPLLILAKNIGGLFLLKYPDWNEDFQRWKKEKYVICTIDGVPFSETELPEEWMEEGFHIKVLFPFRLQTWRRSMLRPDEQIKRKGERDRFCFLTVLALEAKEPYGSPLRGSKFWKRTFKPIKPIFTKLQKKIKKFQKKFKLKKKWVQVLKFFKVTLKFLLTVRNKIFSKRVGLPVVGLRDESIEIKKEKDSAINNNIVDESSIQDGFMNQTSYSDLLSEQKKKNLANITRTLKNKIERFTKEKNFESPQNLGQILKKKKNRLIRKSNYFNTFFRERLLGDLFLYIINILRINIEFCLESTKNFREKHLDNNEKIKERVENKKKKPMEFIKSLFYLVSHINKNSKIISDFSFLSQAYVFYKLSQAEVSNLYLYKLRSIFQYRGTFLFLKNELKNSFVTQVITSSKLTPKKLQNYGQTQWKNWLKLKSNYQYDLSQLKWSQLELQKWRNRITEYCEVEKKNLQNNKRNSDKKDQLLNAKNIKNSKNYLLIDQKDYFKTKKNEKYNILAYNFIFYEDKKDSYSYGEPLQVNKNQVLSYTYNYYISTNKLIDIWYTNSLDKNRKYFDWKIINFSLRKKEELLSHPIPKSLVDFFPQFLLLYNAYKMKPWVIPINSIFENQDNDIEINIEKRISQKNQYKRNSEIDLELFCEKYLIYQLYSKHFEDDKFLINILNYCLMLKMPNPTNIGLTALKKNELDLAIMVTDDISVPEALKLGFYFISPIRPFVNGNGPFILYQTIGISLTQKSKHTHTKKKKRKIGSFDLLVPETILSPRRRRKLRILMCLNSSNNNGMYRNAVSYNRNHIQNKDLRHENNTLKYKVLLWPNYRLEDLACMNRYWFDTNNGSCFSLLRLRMYPRFKMHL